MPPSSLPVGDPVPEDGSLPQGALEGVGERPFGLYVHVPFCTVRCGYCDFNTYTAEELGGASAAPGASRATYAEAAIEEVRRARKALGRPRRPGLDGLLRRGDAHAAAGRRPDGGGRGDRGRVRAGAGRRGHHRVQPRQRHPRRPRGAARGRDQPGLLRHAVRGRPRAAHAGPHARPAPGPRRGRVGPRGGLRPGQPGPHLRHAGGVARGLGDLAGRGAGLRAGPRVGVLAHRGGRDRAGPAGAARRPADARRRRPRRQVHRSPTSGSWPPAWGGTRSRTGRATRPAGAATTCSTGPAPTGGASGPGAHSHVGGVRWWNVKHPAAYADRLAAGRSPAHAREVLDAESRRVERVLLELRLREGLDARGAGRRPAARRSPTWWPAACS